MFEKCMIPRLNADNFISLNLNFEKLQSILKGNHFQISASSVLNLSQIKYAVLFSPDQITVDVCHPFVVCLLKKSYLQYKECNQDPMRIYLLSPVFSCTSLLFGFKDFLHTFPVKVTLSERVKIISAPPLKQPAF